MPIYEYSCSDCGTLFSALRRMSEADELISCEQCEGHNTSRALSVFAASIRGARGESRAISGSNGCGSCSSHHCSSCRRN